MAILRQRAGVSDCSILGNANAVCETKTGHKDRTPKAKTKTGHPRKTKTGHPRRQNTRRQNTRRQDKKTGQEDRTGRRQKKTGHPPKTGHLILGDGSDFLSKSKKMA
jgi:hypothetical protein